MTELLTAAQMRAIEQAAIESGEVTGLELMERAGRGVVEAVFDEWPELAQAPHRAVVLCGPGNNGGDGFVVARLLKEWGWEVEVFLYGDPDKLPPDAKVNYERWDGKTNAWGPNLVSIAGSADLLVDSLFGIGLNRPVPDEIWEEIAVLYGGPRPKRAVAIDVPSGLNGDTGLDPAEDCSIFVADLTVTFHKKKVGHESNFGPDFCGKVVVKDIGL